MYYFKKTKEERREWYQILRKLGLDIIAARRIRDWRETKIKLWLGHFLLAPYKPGGKKNANNRRPTKEHEVSD